MPDFDDYHAFTSTSGGERAEGWKLSGCFPWILAILCVLWLLGKLAG